MTSLNPVLTVGTRSPRSLQRHQRHVAARGPRARPIELLRPRRHPRPGAPARRVPAPALRRHAPAGDDRHGARLPSPSCSSPTSRRPRSTSPSRRRSSSCSRQLRRGAPASALVLITHDLGVVAGLCDTVHVMYAGRIVESAPRQRPVRRTRGTPTRSGCSARSRGWTARGASRCDPIAGSADDALAVDRGCAFAPRCTRRRRALRRRTAADARPVATAHTRALLHPGPSGALRPPERR